MANPLLVLTAGQSVDEARQALQRAAVTAAPVVDAASRFEGTITRTGLDRKAGPDHRVGDLADAGAPTVSWSSRLGVASEALTATPLSWVPVLDGDLRVVGTLSVSDLMRAYRRELMASVERIGGLGPGSGLFEVRITADSPAAGSSLRDAGLPNGVLVTSITRDGDVVAPSGDAVILAGDRLSLLGEHTEMQTIGEITPPGPALP